MVYKNCVNDLYTTVQIFDLNLLELAFLDHRLEKKFCIPPQTSILFECSDWLCDVN